MHPFMVLLHLAAAVMLLLWAVRMVRTGMERAHGSALRAALRSRKGGGIGIALAGVALAVMLQSSTAVGVLAAGFASSGIMTVATGMAALLGADFGSALVVKILSFDLSSLIPVLVLLGAVLFLKFEHRRVRQTGRIVLGIGFVLLSLRMLGEATEPLQEHPLLPQIIDYLRGDPLTSFAIAALLTWLMHSSIAAILLFATFASGGLLPVEVALPMVLGANFGAGLIAVWLTRGMSVVARRIPLGNLGFRGLAACAVLAILQFVDLPLSRFGGAEADQLVNFHVAFNAALLILALPFVGPMERLTAMILPEAEVQDGAPAGARESALDRSVLHIPSLALASAKRELLHMGETVSRMYAPIVEVLDSGSFDQIERIRALDNDVDDRHRAIKLFVAEVNRGRLEDDEASLGIELTDFAINLELVGDLIAKTLMPLAEKKARLKIEFSDEGWQEICSLHDRVASNLQLALNVLLSRDVESARHLVREKEIVRKLERDSHERHLQRLCQAETRSIETSDIHLETLHALKEINSLLVTVAYPILTEAGQLLKSRLAESA